MICSRTQFVLPFDDMVEEFTRQGEGSRQPEARQLNRVAYDIMTFTHLHHVCPVQMTIPLVHV
jgi:hypothetical protein